MKNQFCTFSRHALRVFYVMAFCGLVWACKDEYTLDDEKPEWLSENLYSLLENRGNFTNYLRLLEDKDVNTEGARTLKEVLSKTGSKTVFAAPDESWDKFFQQNALLPDNNPWHNATSYDRLSKAQKKLLIHTSMLNNAIVMENLSASDGSGSNPPTPGQYLRRYTDVDVIDSVTYIPAEEIPYTYNRGTEVELPDTSFWKPFRPTAEGGNGKGIYLVTDATRNMMVHFTREYMGRTDIMVTDDDFEKVMGETRKTDDVHVYNSRILEKDGVAENGYLNLVDKVLVPLNNMSEVIRTNGKTNIFSHMLERFSYPSPSTTLTEAYKNLHPDFNSMIYVKKFAAKRGEDGKLQTERPDGKTFTASLSFDPGWNEFYDGDKDSRVDMATMFVPNDNAMFKYFSPGGGGWQLVETYGIYAEDPNAVVKEGDYDALYKKIDQIPLTTLADLLNVIMFPSFTGSVPSKIQTLRDYTSKEELFTPSDLAQIDTCLLANNGAIYIMNQVYGPASYTSVIGPANISTTNKVMQWAIRNGEDYSTDVLHMNYFAYLMAMRSVFTFFLPSDSALLHYYDPLSFTSKRPRFIQFKMAAEMDKETKLPLEFGKGISYKYDVTTAKADDESPWGTDRVSYTEIANRIKDILESHTIVHTDGRRITQTTDQYYLAKNGSAIKVTKEKNPDITDVDNPYLITKVQGGYQLENERASITGGSPGTFELNIPKEKSNDMKNGHTIILEEAPIIPASKSIYYIISQDPMYKDDCSAFYAMTDMSSEAHQNIIRSCGLDIDRLSVWTNSGAVDQNVKFLSSYHYSVFVPTNAAIAAAQALGLPTWDDITTDVMQSIQLKDDGTPKTYDIKKKKYYYWNTPEDSLRVKAKVTYLNNFLRCHFVDGSIFEDHSATDLQECQTSSYDSKNGVFIKVHVKRDKEGDSARLKVQDDQGGAMIQTTGTLRNIMTRDMTVIVDATGSGTGTKKTPTGQSSLNNFCIQSSSFAVVHQIDGVLCHTPLVGGRYDSNWASPSACKRYLQRYPITDKTTR